MLFDQINTKVLLTPEEKKILSKESAVEELMFYKSTVCNLYYQQIWKYSM